MFTESVTVSRANEQDNEDTVSTNRVGQQIGCGRQEKEEFEIFLFKW